ncbi:RNA polymerase sigma factor [Ruminococcus flavefaciens]|uniref:RNA polymerase sigma-70 region 2 domain-containing protein n=1 Tax=Ruminococcus flavefaciens 007c TaxID=1341157 RepID=W7UIL2_RUMFL|nr:sigma-70 family RNA polymerase sigma factor [Ruminococcus flavefaciens]EWM53613.1 hypothetical protein RF007C_06015 [Ruminococcus flavefaciens 007c]
MTDEDIREIMHHSPDTGFRALFEKYHRYVYTIVHRILSEKGCSKDIDDCVVDVFSDVIIHYDTSSEGSLQAYLGTSAKNKAISLKKSILSKTSNSVSIEDSELELADNSSLADNYERSELVSILLDKIDTLGKPDSDIIINKFFFSRNSREISDIVGLSPAAVRVRCRRALKKLKKLLEPLDITL